VLRYTPRPTCSHWPKPSIRAPSLSLQASARDATLASHTIGTRAAFLARDASLLARAISIGLGSARSAIASATVTSAAATSATDVPAVSSVEQSGQPEDGLDAEGMAEEGLTEEGVEEGPESSEDVSADVDGQERGEQESGEQGEVDGDVDVGGGGSEEVEPSDGDDVVEGEGEVVGGDGSEEVDDGEGSDEVEAEQDGPITLAFDATRSVLRSCLPRLNAFASSVDGRIPDAELADDATLGRLLDDLEAIRNSSLSALPLISAITKASLALCQGATTGDALTLETQADSSVASDPSLPSLVAALSASVDTTGSSLLVMVVGRLGASSFGECPPPPHDNPPLQVFH